MFVVCWVVFVVRCLLSVVGSLLFVACCLLSFGVRCLLVVVCSLFVTGRFFVCYFMFVVGCSLFACGC